MGQISIVPPARSTRVGADDSMITGSFPILEARIPRNVLSIHSRVFVVARRRFQMNLFLNFVTQAFNSLDRGMFNLLKTFGYAFLDFFGNPEPFDEIKTYDTKHHNHE